MHLQFGAHLCSSVRSRVFSACRIELFGWPNLFGNMIIFLHIVNTLNWLPISHEIRLRSVCAVFHYYHQERSCLLLDPHIQFRWQYLYQIRCRKDFASVALCRLASTKRNFCFAATSWWNLLPSFIHDCTMNSINFTKAIRNFYMDSC